MKNTWEFVHLPGACKINRALNPLLNTNVNKSMTLPGSKDQDWHRVLICPKGAK